jgi:hypothetical protein
MSVKPTNTELLAAGFTQTDLICISYVRQKILAVGTKQQLIDKAVNYAQRHKFDKNKPRGLWYMLCDIFYPERSTSICCPEIADAIDPSWQLLPSPSEL